MPDTIELMKTFTLSMMAVLADGVTFVSFKAFRSLPVRLTPAGQPLD